MPEDSLRELRRKHNEERKNEMSALINFMMTLAERDCFPSAKFMRKIDKDNHVTEYQFEFANPWYVSEPVSTVQNATVVINDVRINSNKLAIVIRDQKIPIEVARTFHEVWWGFAEIARISIAGEALQDLSEGQQIELEFYFDMRTTMNYGVKDNLAHYMFQTRMEVG